MPIFDYNKTIENNYHKALKGLFNKLYGYVLTGNIESVVNSKPFNTFINSLAYKMITGIAVANAKDWREAAREGMKGKAIYESLQKEMQGPIGFKIQSLVDNNAKLIKSISQSFTQDITTQIKENTFSGKRSTVYAEKLFNWSETNGIELTEARCRMIARTETSKAQVALTQARCEQWGINWYQWKTSEDARVRSSHKIIDDVLVNWNNPPSPEALDNIKSTLGHYHAGCCPNCRCYAKPILNLNRLKFPVKVYYGGAIVSMSKEEFYKIAA